MATLLSDHDCEGQSEKILHSLRKLGYVEWLGIEILFFKHVSLPLDSTDEEVWRFCQKNNYYLLTGNRNTKAGEASLHAVLYRLVDEESLPVITISNPGRVLSDNAYCEACAKTIGKIILHSELYIGVPRLYIP